MLNLFVPAVYYERMGIAEKKTPREWTQEHYDCEQKLMFELVNVNTGERCLLYICYECGSVVKGDNLVTTKDGENMRAGELMEQHIARHKELHKNLDELMADYIRHTKKTPSETTLMDFMKWSYSQTLNPTGD